jgi:hypothetical protein
MHGGEVETEEAEALERIAQHAMQREHNPDPMTNEPMVTNMLIHRWMQLHKDCISDCAHNSVYHAQHRLHGEVLAGREDATGDAELECAYYLDVESHLQVVGLDALLEAQEGRAL